MFEALAPTGLRATVGKCLMDVRGEAPARLHQDARAGLDEAIALHRQWHGAANGRLRAALAPRFAISCSRELLEATASLSRERGLLVHTHASEQREEIDVVRASTGMDNLAYLAAVGLASPRLCAAHCVHVSDAEQALLAEHAVKVLHCPSSNLKLGSGIAPVTEMRARGISVSLGADGAACNNTLDMFQEMRLAATLQAMRSGPGALTGARRRLDGDARRGAGARTRRRDRRHRAGRARRRDCGCHGRPAPLARCRSLLHAGLRLPRLGRARHGHRRRNQGARWSAQLGGLARPAGRGERGRPQRPGTGRNLALPCYTLAGTHIRRVLTLHHDS